jgi:hypothetical protein
MPDFLKSIWSDPVWSKVISAAIIALFASVGTWILNDQKTKWPIIGMIVFAVGLISCLMWYWNASRNDVLSTPSTATPTPLVLPPHPATTTVGEPAQQPRRIYSKPDADRMLSALRELYETINSNVDAIGRVNGFWLSPGQQMQGKSVKEKVEIAMRVRARVRALANDIYQVIIPKYHYDAEELRPLIKGDGVIGQANGALNDFMAATDVLPPDATEPLIKSVLETKQANLDNVMSDFVSWVRDSKTRISRKRSEIESQREEEQKPAETSNQPIISGSGNIVTFNQTGGQNVINQAPKPELKQLHNDVRQNPDGSQTASILAEVIAPYPPGSLFIKATSPYIAALNVIPQRAGASVTGHSGKREGYAFTTLMNPFGKYIIEIQTSKPESVALEYQFE